jgi:hypothetical protein
VIVHTAIEATLELAKQNPQADFTPVVEALNQIVEANPQQLEKAQLPRQAQFDARRALKTLDTTK